MNKKYQECKESYNNNFKINGKIEIILLIGIILSEQLLTFMNHTK